MKRIRLVSVAMLAVLLVTAAGCAGRYQLDLPVESSAEENSIWAVKTMDVEINGKTVEISGQLENISGKALSFIDMNVSLLDCSGVIIGSGDAHILFKTAIEDGNSADYRITIKNIRRPEDICEVDMNFSE
ncbi:MAG: FxLYD domain-containing protein [Eubacteriales bacterium]|nr:FxLYD domain-containing protein [Eubacteriales bacterium]